MPLPRLGAALEISRFPSVTRNDDGGKINPFDCASIDYATIDTLDCAIAPLGVTIYVQKNTKKRMPLVHPFLLDSE